MSLPREVLDLIEKAVDRDLRSYRPRPATIFDRVKWRCRRGGWALNGTEEMELHRTIDAYLESLGTRPRIRHITDIV
jgi:hypothetical protein